MSAKVSAPMDPTIVYCPRRSIRRETDLCPKVPADFQLALEEAMLELEGWPIEDDDTDRQLEAALDKRMQQQAELDALYYEDWLYREELEWEEMHATEDDDMFTEEDPDDRDTEFFDSHLDYGDYGDEPYEAMRRDPLTNATYDDWYD